MPRLIKRRSSMWNGRNPKPYYPIEPAVGPHPQFSPGPRANRTHPKFIRARLGHALACRGFGRVPPAWLTSDYFRMLDAEGINIFHLAAQKGWMDRIPARLLTEANLQCICYPNYWTAFYWAAFLGNLNHVPIHLLTPSNLNECDFEGRTIFHWAALYGQLNLLPDECLTRNNLSKPDDIDGSTPLHWAATHGHLNQIPERVKTREDLMLKNWPDASTVYQHAAADGNLHQVPVDLLDAGAILEKDTKGRTVLEYSVEHCQLSLLPISEQLATRIVEVKARLTDARHRLASKKMDMHKQQDILSCTRAWEVELARLALKPRGKELVIGAR